MNQGETQLIAESLREKGHEEVNTPEEADRALIGSCIVIGKTENRMKKRVKELSKTTSKVLVAGCLSTTRKDELLSEYPNLEFITPDEIEMSDSPNCMQNDNPHVASIPVASGCEGNCSYCITKLARGSLESRSIETIKERFEELVNDSVKEIRLTSQDMSIYGKDRDVDLIDLLKELLKIEGDYRIRVGMMNVDGLLPVKEGLKDLMKDPRIYNFLHLPLQTGSDALLEKMRRRYTVEEWLQVAEEFRDVFPDITLSTDVIVGFPGEKEYDFEMTKQVIKEAKPDIVNVTRFSPRQGTSAYEMDDQVHSQDKKKRSKEMTNLRLKISRERNEKFTGEERSALFLEEGKCNSIKGRMDNYKVVVLKERISNLLGDRRKVKI